MLMGQGINRVNDLVSIGRFIGISKDQRKAAVGVGGEDVLADQRLHGTLLSLMRKGEGIFPVNSRGGIFIGRTKANRSDQPAAKVLPLFIKQAKIGVAARAFAGFNHEIIQRFIVGYSPGIKFRNSRLRPFAAEDGIGKKLADHMTRNRGGIRVLCIKGIYAQPVRQYQRREILLKFIKGDRSFFGNTLFPRMATPGAYCHRHRCQKQDFPHVPYFNQRKIQTNFKQNPVISKNNIGKDLFL